MVQVIFLTHQFVDLFLGGVGGDKTFTNFTTKSLQIDVERNVIGSTSTIKINI